MSRYAAYIDESGNADLATEKDGTSRYFIVLAVVVERESLPALTAAVAEIKNEFFGAGEMKSSNVKEARRVRILSALAPLPFRFYAVAVDKARIFRDSGLTYKTSFIKFANGRLYNALFQNLTDLTVHADGHGGAEFIESFKKYIETAHTPDLFSRPHVEVVDSKHEVLVQLADFLVGTAAKIYEDKASAEARKVFLDFLGMKRIRIDEWPPRFESQCAAAPGSGDLNEQVRSISLRAAAQFLSDFSEIEDIESRMQHAFLSYLLFRAQFPADEEFMSTQELIEHLSSLGFEDVDKHYLRSNIVSKLRDRGVLIASSSRGYKIPTAYPDVIGFAELVDGIVSPLLHRLRRANEVFSLGSGGAINFLADERFRKLRQILELDSTDQRTPDARAGPK